MYSKGSFITQTSSKKKIGPKQPLSRNSKNYKVGENGFVIFLLVGGKIQLKNSIQEPCLLELDCCLDEALVSAIFSS